MTKTNTRWCTVHDVQLEMIEGGQGRPILFLHGEDGLDPQAPFLTLLANSGHVFAPSHPGFGHSPEVDWIDTVDDLSYLYLDFLEAQDLNDVIVIGNSLGGWIAAEMAVKATARIAKLVLIAPVGIKVGDREARDIPDIFALSPNEVMKLIYHDPAVAAVDYSKQSDDQLTAMARNREATVLYAWEPYFHNPKLRRRLRRIDVPTLLLWGANDQFVTPGYYGAAYRDAIPGARLETIARAGHLPHVEQPEAVVEKIRMFIK
ncbi:MAG: alpha/beta hydrolase [Deltaproteobacteria bacterium]|nr:alpha/beta hydrolase [Deltaproteobacteria bacterium]